MVKKKLFINYPIKVNSLLKKLKPPINNDKTELAAGYTINFL